MCMQSCQVPLPHNPRKGTHSPRLAACEVYNGRFVVSERDEPGPGGVRVGAPRIDFCGTCAASSSRPSWGRLPTGRSVPFRRRAGTWLEPVLVRDKPLFSHLPQDKIARENQDILREWKQGCYRAPFPPLVCHWVSHSVNTTLLPTEHMVHIYTHSVLNECIAESQSQGGGERAGIAYPAFLILPRRAYSLRLGSQRRVNCGVSAHRRTARRGRTRGWDMSMGSAGAGGCWKGGGASPLCSIVRHLARSAASSGQRAWSRG
jgi:hypothetical protein